VNAILPLLATLFAAPAAAANAEGQELATKLATANAGYADMVANIDMRLADAKGREAVRVLRMSVLEREGGDYSLLEFQSPADLKGMVLLSHPGKDTDQQWLYLPALDRTQRITSGRISSSFGGSEFAYEDMTSISVDKHSWTLLEPAACGEAQCTRLQAEPRYEGSGYQRRVLWLSDDSRRLEHVDFYGRDGAHQKTLTYDDYVEVTQGVWRARDWTMVNHRTQRKTVLHFDQIALGNGLTVAEFSPEVLD